MEKTCPLLLGGNPSNVGGKATCKEHECAWWWCGNCALVSIAMGAADVQSVADAVANISGFPRYERR